MSRASTASASQGIAEPLAYEDFVAQENLPGDFGSICVRFVTDEDSLVQEYHIPYGSDFPTDQLPPVPNHQGPVRQLGGCGSDRHDV